MAGYNRKCIRQEGDHAHSTCLYYSGEQKLQQLEGSVVGRSWFSSAEDSPFLVKSTADKRRTISGSQLCEGGDSPVSVIHAASKHLMQVSHPSSACTSMEHPLHSSCGSPPQILHLQRVRPAAMHQSQILCAAGSISERVQQAFSKPLELTPTKVYESNETSEMSSVRLQSSKGKPWPYYTHRSMEWLNLQEDMSSLKNSIAMPTQTFASSPEDDDHASAGAHAQNFPVYSSNSREDQDEESVIDFFPTSNRPSSALQLRRRSYERGAVKEAILLAAESRKTRGAQPAADIAGAEADHQRLEEAPEEGVSKMTSMRGTQVASCTSSKWEDAERWLTCRGPVPPHFNMLFKAGTPQLIQDKHVPENLNSRVSDGSHASRKDAGTKVASDVMRDMATQSTPADCSRCDSPTSERPNFGTGAEKISVATAAKTSPPRHNTPARRSISCSRQSETKQLLGCAPAAPPHLNLLELQSCHLDKLKLARDMPVGTSGTWQLFPDEDFDSSVKLLDRKATPLHELAAKHHQQAKVNMLEARVSAWEDVERAKHIAKFKREGAKIEAWENLQRAEAEAELRKLEVKLEKLRFEGREKIMARLGAAQRRAQEMRGAAEAHQAEQLTRVGMRANQIRKSGHVPSSTYNIVCSLTSKIKPTSNLSFA